MENLFKLILGIIIWSILQSVLAYNGFYQDTSAMPPRFALVFLPTTACIVYALFSKQQDLVFQYRNTKRSTFLHIIRIPVELVLLQLYIHKMVPEIMTFEGFNFDILVGFTAPLVGFLYLKNKISKKVLLGWNVFGLMLVLLVLTMGLLSAELPFQQLGFDQPNRAVTYFPFVLLPATIVPIVIWTHLSDIIKLVKEIRNR